MAQLLKDLVTDFNLVAKANFNKSYEELEPALGGLAYKFNSGNVGSVDFFITQINSKIKEFKGTRDHITPSTSFRVAVVNKEYDGAVDIPRRELMRAASVESVLGLNVYADQISSLGMEAKDHPFETLLDYLEAGDASTYGTTFDGQNMFDTTHAYDNVAGTQSNLLTGTGTTLAQLSTDLKAAMDAIYGFTFTVDKGNTANKKKRALNRNPKFVVVCPTGLRSKFEDLKELRHFGVDGATENSLRNSFDIIVRPFTDANDWYLIDVSEPLVRPFVISEEESPRLETPEMNPHQLREHKVMTWGIEGMSYGIMYGAWWKAVQTTNA